MKRKYGWRPDIPDHRDTVRKVSRAKTPPCVDLRPKDVPIYDQGALGSCFLGDALVSMADGSECPINEIGIGNEVITYDGTIEKVYNIFQRLYSGLLYSIKLKGWSYPLTATEEHPIATVENIDKRAKWGTFTAGKLIWKKIKDLKPGDFVLMTSPNVTKQEINPRIKISDYISDPIIEYDGRIRLLSAKKSHSILSNIETNEEFCKLIGLFLSEGSYEKFNGKPVGINFTFARQEKEYQIFVKNAIKNIFDAESHIQENVYRESVSDVNCSNATIARFFYNLCGEHALHKFINPLFFNCSKNSKMSLIQGWMEGDGTQNKLRTENKKGIIRKSIYLCGTTSSIKLHRDFFRLGLSVGIKFGSSISKQQPHQNANSRNLFLFGSDVLKVFPDVEKQVTKYNISLNKNKQHYKHHDFGFLCKIENIEIKEAKNIDVYNLEISGNHTYVVNCIAVHNCTANAICGAMEFELVEEHHDPLMLSRLFVYYNEREMEGTIEFDAGAHIRDGIKSVASLGACPESEWPYSDANPGPFTAHPSRQAYEDALTYTVISYDRVPRTLVQLKSVLASGSPFIFGFTVYESFEDEKVINTGVLDMPSPDEVCIGGHAVVCLHEDTKIPLLDGRNIALKDAANEFKDKDFWVYSSTSGGHIVPGHAHSLYKTGENRALIKITLDNGEFVRCTSDHLFMMRDGSYKKASDINVNDSLMPFYRKLSDCSNIKDYEMVLHQDTKKWQFTHRLIASMNGKYSGIVHHADFNKHNNNPDNLQIMNWDEHTALHNAQVILLNEYAKSEKGREKSRELMQKLWNNKEWREESLKRNAENGKIVSHALKEENRCGFQSQDKKILSSRALENGLKNHAQLHTRESEEKATQTLKEKFLNDEDFRIMKQNIAIENIYKYNSTVTKEQKKLNGLKSKWARCFKDKYNTFEEFLYIVYMAEQNNQKFCSCCKEIKFLSEFTRGHDKYGLDIYCKICNSRKHKKNLMTCDMPNNHKVSKIENDGFGNVYDLTVDEYHNFALSSGIFVHNCVGYDDRTKLFTIRNSYGPEWGNKGYFTMPYDYLLNHNLSDDFWAIRSMKHGPGDVEDETKKENK